MSKLLLAVLLLLTFGYIAQGSVVQEEQNKQVSKKLDRQSQAGKFWFDPYWHPSFTCGDPGETCSKHSDCCHLMPCCHGKCVKHTDDKESVSTRYRACPHSDSNCCTQVKHWLHCNMYGCLVNNGLVDKHTPCDPLGKDGEPTWLYCKESGCISGSDCTECSCDTMFSWQKAAVNIDVCGKNAGDVGKGLLWAYKRHEATANIGCDGCGFPDRGRFQAKLSNQNC